MPMNNLIQNKSLYFTTIFLLSSMYLWKKVYKMIGITRKEFEKEKLFLERHNCVIIYSRKHMSGWPLYKCGVPIELGNSDLLLEPFIYFISTAEYSLEIAHMMIKIPQIIQNILEVSRRGVCVRIILNFESMRTDREIINAMLRAGIKLQIYVPKEENMASIMHYKYVVKDYRNETGFLSMGSMNLASVTTLENNYENVTFTTHPHAVTAFHQDFNRCWKSIEEDNKSVFSRSVLREAKLF